MTGSGLCGYDIINKSSMEAVQVLNLHVRLCVLVGQSERERGEEKNRRCGSSSAVV